MRRLIVSPRKFVLNIPIEIGGKLYKPSVRCYEAYPTIRYCLDLEEIEGGNGQSVTEGTSEIKEAETA